MIDRFLVRLREPRVGVVVTTAVLSLLMAAHWAPMIVPGLVALALCVVRPEVALRPVVWWVMAGLWFTAVLVAQEQMEDHVYLFSVWLVALAISLAVDGGGFVDPFIDQAAWYARVLVGITFTVAVAWKLFFNQFVTGMALWTFILIDGRFAPLARGLGLSGATVHDGQGQLSALLEGTAASYQPPSQLIWRVAVVAVLTLLLEAGVAASYLAPDGSLPARLRLPSIVLFGLATYAVVPVLPFAALLATLAMVTARWRPQVMWVFPVMVLSSVVRLVTLQLW